MSESVLAASGFSLVSLWFQAEKGTLPTLECLSFANTIQADLPTCDLVQFGSSVNNNGYVLICKKFYYLPRIHKCIMPNNEMLAIAL